MNRHIAINHTHNFEIGGYCIQNPKWTHIFSAESIPKFWESLVMIHINSLSILRKHSLQQLPMKRINSRCPIESGSTQHLSISTIVSLWWINQSSISNPTLRSKSDSEPTPTPTPTAPFPHLNLRARSVDDARLRVCGAAGAGRDFSSGESVCLERQFQRASGLKKEEKSIVRCFCWSFIKEELKCDTNFS